MVDGNRHLIAEDAKRPPQQEAPRQNKDDPGQTTLGGTVLSLVAMGPKSPGTHVLAAHWEM